MRRCDVTVEPTKEPVTAAEAAPLARVTAQAAISLLEGYIKPARRHVETLTHRQLVTATRKLTLDAFPASSQIELPFPPLQEVTQVRYKDENGNWTVMVEDTDFVIELAGGGATPAEQAKIGCIRLPYDGEWPIAYNYPGSVEITFTCGYPLAANDSPTTPEDLKKAVAIAATDYYYGTPFRPHIRWLCGPFIAKHNI